MSEPIDVDAYEAAGVVRVEKAQEPDCCVNGCQCRDAVYDEFGNEVEPADRWDCEHCPNCCGCTPCMYAQVA